MSLALGVDRGLRFFAGVALVAALAGAALHLDVGAADVLAPKAFWLALAAGTLAAAALLKPWLGGLLRAPRASLALAWALLFAVLGLSWALSPLRAQAGGAVQAWAALALLFLGAFDLLEREDAWVELLHCSNAVVALAGAWSVAQALGLDHSVMGEACRAAFGPRIAGSLGNPNFAGGFFVLALPVTLWGAWREPKPWARRLARGASALAALGLALSASKAALLGLTAEAAVAEHLLFWSDAGGARKRQAMLVLALGLVLAGALALAVLPAASRQRLWTGWKPDAESIQFRRTTWGGALQAVKERPLLGWGPGTFSAVYPGHRLPQATAGLAQRSYEVSHAENWMLQTLVEEGLLGLAALLLLLLSVLWPLRLAAKAWDAPPIAGGLALALLSGLLGSLACNLASLDSYLPSTLLPFVVLSAMAAHVAGLPLVSLSLKPQRPYVRAFFVTGLVALLALLPWTAGQRWRASRDLRLAKAYSEAGRFDDAIPLYRHALALDASNLEARYFLGSSLQDRAKGSDGADAEREYAALRQWAPDYVLVHAKLARLYTAQDRWDEAAAEWERQLQLDPYLMPATQELSSLYASRNRLADAHRVLVEAIVRFPSDHALQANLAVVDQALAKKGQRHG